MQVRDWNKKAKRQSKDFIGTTSQLCAKCIASQQVGLCQKCQSAVTKEKRGSGVGGYGSKSVGRINRFIHEEDKINKRITKNFDGTNHKYTQDITERISRILVSEVTVVGGSYIDGTVTNVTGSGQTRVGAEEFNVMPQMQQKEPENKEAVKFSNLLGAYVPKEKQKDQKEFRWSMSI